MTPKLKDIAERAGVDIGTVSHVLNRRPKADRLKAETRERIQRIAKELGYCRNELAASIAGGRGNVLAFISAEMGCIEYTGRIQNGVLDEAAAQDYAVTVYHLTGKNEEDIIRKLIGWRTAGVIFHIARLDAAPRIMKILDEQKIPYGTANLGNPRGIGVTTDDSRGMECAVEFLKQSGCRRAALLTHEDKSRQQAEYQKRRREGFRKGMKQHFPEAPETVFTLSPEQGKQAFQRSMDQILKKITGGGYDGILCDSDITAIELLQSAQTAGLKVPEAFSLIGYGNLGISSLMRPALTTLSQNFEEIGSMTTRFVIDAVRNGQSAEQERNLLLPVKLIIRDSTQKT